jgi:hypothetical protein
LGRFKGGAEFQELVAQFLEQLEILNTHPFEALFPKIIEYRSQKGFLQMHPFCGRVPGW